MLYVSTFTSSTNSITVVFFFDCSHTSSKFALKNKYNIDKTENFCEISTFILFIVFVFFFQKLLKIDVLSESFEFIELFSSYFFLNCVTVWYTKRDHKLSSHLRSWSWSFYFCLVFVTNISFVLRSGGGSTLARAIESSRHRELAPSRLRVAPRNDETFAKWWKSFEVMTACFVMNKAFHAAHLKHFESSAFWDLNTSLISHSFSLFFFFFNL